MKLDSFFDCPRCNAKGYISEFRHVANGVCFLCGGAKQITHKQIKILKDHLTVFYFKKHKELETIETISVRQLDRNGCTVWSHEYKITEQNKSEMRILWKELKNNGHDMQIKEIYEGLVENAPIEIPTLCIRGTIKKVTDKAIYVCNYWIPKSILTYTDYGDSYITPKWFKVS